MTMAMGRPTKDLDMNQLTVFMRFKPTLEDCAAYFKVSTDLIERRIRKEHGVTFAEFRDQNMVHTRMSLIQEALQRAKKSDTMLIFCLKNLCGWKDKLESDIKQTSKIEIDPGHVNSLLELAKNVSGS